MLGKSFIIGVVFAGLSAGVVYFGVGETLELASSPESNIDPAVEIVAQNLEPQNTDSNANIEDADIQIETFSSQDQAERSAPSQEVVTTVPDTIESSRSNQTNVTPQKIETPTVKTDRVLLDEAKLAANTGLYLNSADLIAEIKSPLMRDTARSNLALALARDGERDYAMAVIEDVETDALVEIIRAQVNQVLSQ